MPKNYKKNYQSCDIAPNLATRSSTQSGIAFGKILLAKFNFDFTTTEDRINIERRNLVLKIFNCPQMVCLQVEEALCKIGYICLNLVKICDLVD